MCVPYTNHALPTAPAGPSSSRNPLKCHKSKKKPSPQIPVHKAQTQEYVPSTALKKLVQSLALSHLLSSTSASSSAAVSADVPLEHTLSEVRDALFHGHPGVISASVLALRGGKARGHGKGKNSMRVGRYRERAGMHHIYSSAGAFADYNHLGAKPAKSTRETRQGSPMADKNASKTGVHHAIGGIS